MPATAGAHRVSSAYQAAQSAAAAQPAAAAVPCLEQMPGDRTTAKDLLFTGVPSDDDARYAHIATKYSCLFSFAGLAVHNNCFRLNRFTHCNCRAALALIQERSGVAVNVSAAPLPRSTTRSILRQMMPGIELRSWRLPGNTRPLRADGTCT